MARYSRAQKYQYLIHQAIGQAGILNVRERLTAIAHATEHKP